MATSSDHPDAAKEEPAEKDNSLRNYILGGFILAAVAGQVVSCYIRVA